MRDAANIATVAALRPDYLGFIEYAASPRFVGTDFRIPQGIPENIKRVGVFVNESYDGIVTRSAASGYGSVQLHGDESPALCAQLQAAGLGVIKVFRIDDTFDFATTVPYKAVADVFLFDARGLQPGGNGIRFNLNTLNRYDQEIPFFLSGGLHPGTLPEDIRNLSDMNLHGVDMNSGVEQSPGMKDPVRVAASIRYVRNEEENTR